jgi:hypothetical protein
MSFLAIDIDTTKRAAGSSGGNTSEIDDMAATIALSPPTPARI